MGNLFRCPMAEKREYIMKAGGIVQKGYEVKYVKYYDTTYGNVHLSSGSIWLEGKGYLRAYYEFDATEWNKLHVKQASGYHLVGGAHMIGITKYEPSSGYDIEDALFIKIYLPAMNLQDYVMDISSLSGIHYFCMFVKSSETSSGALTEIDINGDVYLST